MKRLSLVLNFPRLNGLIMTQAGHELFDTPTKQRAEQLCILGLFGF